MSVTCSKTLEFRNDIESLISQIDACMPADRTAADREHQLQQQAYRERRSQARSLFQVLASHGEERWSVLDGDAHRIREALKLSLEFFRRLL